MGDFKGRSGGKGGFGGGNRGGGFKRTFGPEDMHDATCSACKKACKVPFKPIEGRPVFCKECYASQK